MERYEKVKRETATLGGKAAAEELKVVYDMEGLSSRNLQLQQDVRSKNLQLALLLLLLLVSTGAGTIIHLQHRRLKRNVKAMFQMNLSLAYSSRDEARRGGAGRSEEEAAILSDDALYRMILKKMEEKMLSKDPQLELEDLAKQVRRPRHLVSKAIKNAGKTNFLGLVNEFKVNEARRLIMEKGDSIHVSEIALLAGFNSRSSFYRHFKEITGFTPTDYLELMKRAEGPPEEVGGEG